MTLEEFKEFAKTVTREEFIDSVIEGNIDVCPSEYGLKESCGDNCGYCARNSVKDIKFRDDIEAEKDFVAAMNKQPIIFSDSVNHPSHYTHGKIETIDKIEDVLGLEGFQAYCVGNAIKYLDRYKLKNGFEDIKKAKRYLEFYIEKTEGKEC